MTEDPEKHDSFENAGDQASQGLVGEFIGFMRDNAKWWLIPFLVVFAALGLIVLLAGTGAAPFIYALF